MSDVHPVCVRFHTAIELLGARWSGAILRVMFTGSHRYADIRGHADPAAA
jgi:DNA-binding HxlR family transcriptional regulator